MWEDAFLNDRGISMKLREKVELLVKYCGQYKAHGFMIDERNQDKGFDIRMPEENFIYENIEKLRIILLTGEAGDGKSRILRNIKPMLLKNGFSEPCSDFSALPEADKDDLLKRLRAILDGESGEKILILANIGIFTQITLEKTLKSSNKLGR